MPEELDCAGGSRPTRLPHDEPDLHWVIRRHRGVIPGGPSTAAGPGGSPLPPSPRAPNATSHGEVPGGGYSPIPPRRPLCDEAKVKRDERARAGARRASRAARPRCYTRQGRASHRARAAARLCNAITPRRRMPEERGDARRARTTRAHLRATITRGDDTRAVVPRRKRTKAAPSPTKTTAPRPTNGTTRRAGHSLSSARTASTEKASATTVLHHLHTFAACPF